MWGFAFLCAWLRPASPSGFVAIRGLRNNTLDALNSDFHAMYAGGIGGGPKSSSQCLEGRRLR